MKRGTTKERGASSGALRVLALVLPVVVLVLLAAAAVRFFFFENDKLRQIASSPPSSSAPGEKIDPAAEGPDAHEPSAGTDDGDTPGESGGEPDDIADGAEQNHDITGGKYTYPASFLPYEVYASEENIPPLKNVKVKLNKGIFSACAQLVNLDTGETVYKNNASAPNYPASLTKILTAVVVLESGIPTGEFVTITEEMLSGLFESGASVAGFRAGDTVTVSDLLYGLMLSSGADCANALATATEGSIRGFVEKMNEKASSLGMAGSHFTNPTGLHDVDQYSTAGDLALLLGYALKNDFFHTLFTTAEHTTAATASSPEGIRLRNYLLSGAYDLSFRGGEIMGAKTGFTTPAGQCLASMTEIHGERYILVTMGAGREFGFDDHYSLTDALHLYGLVSSGVLG
ncbi:MAG: D-alanyl-D-alanine carboxypeptidase [Clostridiales bacterium]|nr:D-alanyl-D-alanine carboxypeptidase [Clostridiales bacterium]